MTFDVLGDLTADDCNDTRLLFNKDEIVEFIGMEPRVDEAKGHIFIKAKVNSGLHKGKEYTIMIAGGEHEASRKRKATFFFRSGFWKEEELKNKTYQLSRIVGQKFQGKASKVNEKDGNKFQNIDDIKWIGAASADEANAAVNY